MCERVILLTTVQRCPSAPLKRWQNWALWPLWRIWDSLKPEKLSCPILYRWDVHVCTTSWTARQLAFILMCLFFFWCIVSLGRTWMYNTVTFEPSSSQASCSHTGPPYSGHHRPNFTQRHPGVPYSSGAGTMEGRAGGSVWQWGENKWIVAHSCPQVHMLQLNMNTKKCFLQLRKKELSCMQALAEELKNREQEREAIFRKKVLLFCLNLKTSWDYLKDDKERRLLLLILKSLFIGTWV